MKNRLRTAQEVSLSLFYCFALCHVIPAIADVGSLADLEDNSVQIPISQNPLFRGGQNDLLGTADAIDLRSYSSTFALVGKFP